MVKLHLKRLSSPNTWPIPKKTITFITRPNPGGHKLEHQVPISVFLRDMVGVVDSTKEVKFVLHNKDCLIDGKVVHDNKRPVGLLDVVQLPKAKKQYRVSINTKNKLVAVEVPEKEATSKVSKIIKKTSLKKGVMQLNTRDGRSFRIDDAKKYGVGDSLVVALPQQKITDHLPFQKGMTILLEGGRHVGVVGTLEEVEGDIIVVKAGDEIFRTKKLYALVIGKNEPIITVK